MTTIRELDKEKEKNLTDSLKIMDIMAKWIKSKPNEVWSSKQAALFESVYYSINENWRRSRKNNLD